MNCQKEHCDNPAKYQVLLSLAVHEGHPPAISTPVLILCDEHKNEYTKDDFFGPEQWPQICAGFTMMGLAAPTKEHSDIIIEPIPQLN